MNNTMVFGQYYHTNSLIHRMDPRIKIIISILFIVAIFLVPINNFYLLGGLLLITLIMIFASKVPFFKYLKSLKQIIFLLIFTFIFQIIFRQTGTLLLTIEQNISITNIIIGSVIILLYFIFNRYLPFKAFFFLAIICGIIYMLQYPIYGNTLKTYNLYIYSDGLLNGTFIVVRVLVLIMFTTILTLTTKPTSLNNALESLLSPLEKLKIKTSIFAMMVSIALRFIPTLFLEASKILKAQASRGVDFNEGRLKDKIVQIISLLIPMFIISFKRADDLAVAMEARGYVPGEARTKVVVLKCHFGDILCLVFYLAVIVGIILWRIYL